MLIKKFRKQSTAAGVDAAAAGARARPSSDHPSTPLAGLADVCVNCVPASFSAKDPTSRRHESA